MTREEQIIKIGAQFAIDETDGQTSGRAASMRGVLLSAFRAGAHWADSYPNWISVEDVLPPKNGKTQQSISVWATDGLTSGEFRYNFDTKTWTDMWGDPFDITHWMEIQPPRKEEKK